MAGVSTKRCDACREIVLVSDHGRVKTVGGTAYTRTEPNGDTVFACPCGARVVWERQPAHVGERGG